MSTSAATPSARPPTALGYSACGRVPPGGRARFDPVAEPLGGLPDGDALEIQKWFKYLFLNRIQILFDRGSVFFDSSVSDWETIPNMHAPVSKPSHRAALERSVTTLLKPLLRLLLRHGIAYGELLELVKRALVDVAASDFSVPGRKLSISRVAVLTGLTRKEAARLLHRERSEEEAPSNAGYNRAARVLTAWSRDAEYTDERGEPKVLPLETKAGASFAGLVRRFAGDVPPRAVLDELERVGAVSRLRDGRVRALERAYVPHAGDEEKLEILGTDVADLISTIHHNIEKPADRRFFQRKVAYDNLPAEYLKALREIVHRDGQRLLEQLDAEMSHHDRDTSTDSYGSGRKRAMIGIYYFEDDFGDAEAE